MFVQKLLRNAGSEDLTEKPRASLRSRRASANPSTRRDISSLLLLLLLFVVVVIVIVIVIAIVIVIVIVVVVVVVVLCTPRVPRAAEAAEMRRRAEGGLLELALREAAGLQCATPN